MTLDDVTHDLDWRGAVAVALDPLRRVASHDIRSPLNALRLNLTLVRRTLASGQVERWLGVAEDEIDRLEKSFRSLSPLLGAIDFSRPVGDLLAVLVSLDELIASFASKRNVIWQCDAADFAGSWPPGSDISVVATAASAIDHAGEGERCSLVCRRRSGEARLELGGLEVTTINGLEAVVEHLWRGPGGRVLRRDRVIEIQIEESC